MKPLTLATTLALGWFLAVGISGCDGQKARHTQQEQHTTKENNTTNEHNTTKDNSTTNEHNTTNENNSTNEHNTTGDNNGTEETNTTQTASVNHPPIAVAKASAAALPIYTTVTCDGNKSSDPDGDTLHYGWTLTTRPSTSAASLHGADTPQVTIVPDRAGDYTLTLTLSDGSATATATCRFHARATSLFRLTTHAVDNEPWFTDGTAPHTHLITDLNTWTKDANPGKPVRMGDKIFFSADDGEHGRELWVADRDGAHMVKDIFPGATGASPSELTVWQGTLYFAASGADGTTLWYSDGTADGTQPITTDHPPIDPTSLTATDDHRLVFAAIGSDASGQSLGRELWESDGTQSGTRMVADLYTGIASSFPTFLTYVGATHTLYFAASNSGGSSLYSYDLLTGNAPTIVTGGTNIDPKYLFAFGNKVLFSATDTTNGREPWIGDTSGVAILKNLATKNTNKAIDANPYEFTTKDSHHFYFTAYNGQHRYLYLSDGTSGGTDTVSSSAINPAYLTMLSGELFFDAYFGSNDSILWHSDGTSGGTDAVDLTAQAPQAHKTNTLTAYHGTLYFWGNDTEHGTRINSLWSYTPGDVHEKLIRHFAASNLYDIDSMVAGQDGRLYFAVKDKASGKELWHTDGTPAGTALHHDTNRLTRSSRPSRVGTSSITIESVTYHLADASDADGRTALYRTDRSTGTTQRILGDANTTVRFIEAIGSALYIGTYDSSAKQTEIFRIDAPKNAPQRIASKANVQPIAGYNAVHTDSALYFLTDDGTKNYLVALPTDTLAWSEPFNANDIRDLVVAKGQIYLDAKDGTNGFELWHYDPASGTASMTDIRPGASSSNPDALTALGDWLYFFAEDGSTNLGNDLWRIQYDGSGLEKLYDIDDTFGMTFLSDLKATDTALFWELNELGGETKLLRYRPGKTPEEVPYKDPANLTVAGDRLYVVHTTNSAPKRIGWADATADGGLNLVEADKILGLLNNRPIYTRTQSDGTRTLYYGDGEANNEEEILGSIQ